MKKLLSIVLLLALTVPFAISQQGPLPGQTGKSFCRDEKGRCKIDKKANGDYTSKERAECKLFKLNCKILHT
ncbi:hypothetical protein [Roseivirga misakiensis]|uniref:Kazal-like domain-containing protein n=1 Tax=Roseivirga misakiensis TaxID=1563681 RepID=A0A1E5T6Z5_9BACT|nr:hypothetical protein [Roseivirga misakiensis]OEK07118.1 hypothetical protein BFP71_05525 [Roseivirga misakiensis]